MISHPSHPPASPMHRVPITPVRNNFFAHQRHASAQIQRVRPISMTSPPPTMQHMKRSSIYVSDASILLQHNNPMLSPTKPTASASPVSDTPDFIDHYASLELESNASIDEVRSAFRRLRGLYFSTDAFKYRAAQAAFDVLANPAARDDYDLLYRARQTSTADMCPVTPSKHGRADSAHGDEVMSVLSEEEELEAARGRDPNGALKRHRRLYEPVVGTQPYASFVPILKLYGSSERHPVLGCRRPVYIGRVAVNARPN